MISQASIRTYDAMCRASYNRDLCVVASALVATGEPVALLAAVRKDGAETILAPFGIMCSPAPVDDQGVLTRQTQKKFKELDKLLRSQKHQPWFSYGPEGSDGRISVTFALDGDAPDVGQPHLVLAGADPQELFRTPALVSKQAA